jgi:hypothetical protein
MGMMKRLQSEEVLSQCVGDIQENDGIQGIDT